MFVAWRDLTHARGRFALVAGVVALLAVLVGFLSGLTGGLAERNISAVLDLPGDRVVVTPEQGAAETTFATSVVDEEQAAVWASAPGVTAADPLGIVQLRAEADQTRLPVSVLGADVALEGDTVPGAGQALVSAPVADALGLAVGDVLTVGGVELVVGGLVPEDWYNHAPVVWTTLGDWRSLVPGGSGHATALLVSGDADWAAVDAQAGTTSTSALGALALLPAFRSEIGSLLLIVGLLFGISALVVGAFFTVWTIQRRPDIAVLKALGADDRALRLDALGQALVLLVSGTVAGTAVVVGAGLAIGDAMPFVLSPLTTVLPAALMTALGLAGAALALRSIASAEPLLALGGNR